MVNFHTVDATEARACLPLKTTYIVVSNRGDKNHVGAVELSFENSVDTFLLKYDERQQFFGDFSHLCYKRFDDGKADKIRLDVYEA